MQAGTPARTRRQASPLQTRLFAGAAASQPRARLLLGAGLAAARAKREKGVGFSCSTGSCAGHRDPGGDPLCAASPELLRCTGGWQHPPSAQNSPPTSCPWPPQSPGRRTGVAGLQNAPDPLTLHGGQVGELLHATVLAAGRCLSPPNPPESSSSSPCSHPQAPMVLLQAGLRPPRTLFTPWLRVGGMHPWHQEGWAPRPACREHSQGHPIAAIKGQLRRKPPASILSLVPWFVPVQRLGGSAPSPCFSRRKKLSSCFSRRKLLSPVPERRERRTQSSDSQRANRGLKRRGAQTLRFNQATLTGQMRGGHTLQPPGRGGPTPLPQVPLPGAAASFQPRNRAQGTARNGGAPAGRLVLMMTRLKMRTEINYSVVSAPTQQLLPCSWSSTWVGFWWVLPSPRGHAQRWRSPSPAPSRSPGLTQCFIDGETEAQGG